MLASGCEEDAHVARSLDAAVLAPLDARVDSAPVVNAVVDAAADAAVRAASFRTDIEPLLAQHCMPCHAANGIAALALDSWDAVQRVQRAVVDAVATKRMPPFPASPDCNQLKARGLDDPSRVLFMAWADAGFPLGQDAPAPTVQPPAPDLTLHADPYFPALNDEYRCFVLSRMERDTYVRALRIAPSVPLEVHHAQVHSVRATERAKVEQLDAKDPELGYSCPQGPGAQTDLLYSYRPGSDMVQFDPGDAAYIPADSTLLLQVHYNTDVITATPDQTAVSLWALPPGELPDRVLVRTGMTASVKVPPGATHHVATSSSSMGFVGALGSVDGFGGVFIPGELVGIAPHAHHLATRMHASFERDSEQSCLVDVPRWDFHLQLDYLFQRGIPYQAQDRLIIECEYDNSAEHQLVPGSEPREVTWGEKSSDEMCLFYLWLRFERDAFLAANL